MMIYEAVSHCAVDSVNEAQYLAKGLSFILAQPKATRLPRGVPCPDD